MKIAIMTWFSYINYGTFLQVTAISEKLKKEGYLVKIIQYYPQGKIRMRDESIRYYIETIVNKIENYIYKNIIKDINGDEFAKFQKDFLEFTDLCTSETDLENLNTMFDVFICGSDQIWSPLFLDPHYFLNFVIEPGKMIAYAPSLGVSKISNINMLETVRKLSGRFKYLSVRESTGAELLKHNMISDVKVVLDPTLLFNRKEWDKLLELKDDVNDDYLLVYFLGRTKKNWSVVKNLAKKMKLSIKIIPVYKGDLRKKDCIKQKIGPAQFVKLIRNAKYICTDSFHGIAFSINYQRQFCCFKRFSDGRIFDQNSRIYGLLGMVDLIERIYCKKTTNNLLQPIDYCSVNKKLNQLRKNSESFLFDSLSDISHNFKVNNK